MKLIVTIDVPEANDPEWLSESLATLSSAVRTLPASKSNSGWVKDPRGGLLASVGKWTYEPDANSPNREAKQGPPAPVKIKPKAKKVKLPPVPAGWRAVVPVEMRPRITNGTDYGAEAFILLRKGTKMVLWQKGSRYWSGRGEPQAYAIASCTYLDNLQHHGLDKKLFEGGRFKHDRVLDHAKVLGKFLGLPVAKLPELSIGQTLVWES